MTRQRIVSASLALGVFLLLPLAALADVTLPEIVRQNAEELDALVSGRVSYTIERYKSPKYLEMRKSLKRADLEQSIAAMEELLREKGVSGGQIPARGELENFERTWKLEELRLTGQYEVDYVFDKKTDSAKSITTDMRDLDAIAAQLGENDRKTLRLNKTVARSIVADREVRYEDGSDIVSSYISSTLRLDAEMVMSQGYFKRDRITPGRTLEMHQDPESPNLIRLVLTDGERRVEYTVDKAFAFRPIAIQSYVGDVQVFSEACKYGVVGDRIFLREYEKTMFYLDGEVSESEKVIVTNAELNVPISPSEFEVDAPATAGLYNDQTGKFKPGVAAERAALTYEAKQLADDLLVEKFEIGERQAMERDLVGEKESTPVPEPEPPSSSTADAKGSPVPLGVLIVAALAVLAVVVVIALRRRRG